MRKHLIIAACMALLVVSGVAGFQADDLSSPKLRIPWDEFKKLYDNKEAVVVDVRGPDAYVAGHIPESRSIPLDEVNRRVDELKKLNKPIVLYCA